MLLAELLELIRNGENSGVEFKRDDIRPEQLAKELCALANLEGGHVLLGVEDDGSITGLTRDPHKAEEWVMSICRGDALRPPVIPYWETIDADGHTVGVVSLPADLPDRPYEARRGSAWQVFVRRGTTTDEASREEKARLYQSSGLLRYDIRPVAGTSLKDLDIRRLSAYFKYIREQETPDGDDRVEWERLLLNTDFMVEDRGRSIPTVGGILLFGLNPNRWLPQAGITAVAYTGEERDYATREDARLRGPLTPLVNSTKEILDNGLIDQAMAFVNRNIGHGATLAGARREDQADYPLEAVREAVVNAIAHRDYTIAVADVELAIFSNRMEIISPGRLPNTVTVDKMRSGYRATRNELIKEVLRDYRYVDARGLGVPRKIVRLMREINGTEPGLVEEDDRFEVTLFRSPTVTPTPAPSGD
jgi:ATP-dependent DNA helicase RecG